MRTPVFFSWQSDTPAESGQDVIRLALERATSHIAADLSQPYRPEIDQDTRGVPGSPAMVEAILEKINSCAVFVADVTLSYRRQLDRPRSAPNPNVLLELGYALRRLSSHRVLMVLDVDYGGPEELPFDLRGNRVIPYRGSTISPDDSELDSLALRLEDDLRTILRTAGLPDDLAPALDITLEFEKVRIEPRRHDYRLVVQLLNRGSEIIRDWEIEVRFPRITLDPDKSYPIDESASDPSVAVMRMTEQGHSGPIHPGARKTVLCVDYVMNDVLFRMADALFAFKVGATAYVADKKVTSSSRRFGDLQIY
jgi:hypothetical protein